MELKEKETKLFPSHEIRIKEREEARNDLRDAVNKLSRCYKKHRGFYPELYRGVFIYSEHLNEICNEMDMDIKELWIDYDKLKLGNVPDQNPMTFWNRIKPFRAFLAFVFTLGLIKVNFYKLKQLAG